MSNALSAVLQGLESGSRMGLNIYTTLKDQGRADRQEQLQRQRYARQDMEADRTFDRESERFKVADEQWDKSYENAVRGLDQTETQLNDARTHNQGMRSIYNRREDRDDAKFNEDRETTRRQRAGSHIQRINQAYAYDETGRLRSREDFNKAILESGQGGIYLALNGYVNGALDYDRLQRYGDAQMIPAGEAGYAVGVTSAKGEWEGIRPATVNGSSDPADRPLTADPYDFLMATMDAEQIKETRGQNQSDTLIAMDTKDDLAAEEARIERERQKAGADVQSAEAEIAKAQAEIDELEANPPEPVSLLRSMPMSESERRALTRHPEVAEWETKRTSLGDVINTKRGFIQQRTSDLSANEAASQQKVQTRLGQAQYDSVAFPQNYQERKDKKLTEQRDAYTKVKTDNRTTVVNAVKRANTHLEKTLGKKNPLYAEKRLDDNKVLAELERLPAEVQVALAKQPGGLDLMVSTMAESGLTSFNYLIDAMDKQVNMEDYYEVLRNPSTAEIAGRDPDKLHQLATTYAEHKAQNPNAPLEASVLAISRGKRPPTERSSLSNINARDFVPALQLLDATKRSLQ